MPGFRVTLSAKTEVTIVTLLICASFPRKGLSLIVFTPYQRKKMATGPIKQKATRPIRIIKGNAADGTLELPNRGNTDAEAGETIRWQIDNHSGVHSIVAITQKGGTNFWSELPHQQGANWQGTISPEAKEPQAYEYAIHWKASAGGPVLVHDPIISIKPSVPTG